MILSHEEGSGNDMASTSKEKGAADAAPLSVRVPGMIDSLGV